MSYRQPEGQANSSRINSVAELELNAYIYYTGDVANQSWWGRITAIDVEKQQVTLAFTHPETGEECTETFLRTSIGDNYEGHGDPRFVTRQAYRAYHNEKARGYGIVVEDDEDLDFYNCAKCGATVCPWHSRCEGCGDTDPASPPRERRWTCNKCGVDDHESEADAEDCYQSHFQHDDDEDEPPFEIEYIDSVTDLTALIDRGYHFFFEVLAKGNSHSARLGIDGAVDLFRIAEQYGEQFMAKTYPETMAAYFCTEKHLLTSETTTTVLPRRCENCLRETDCAYSEYLQSWLCENCWPSGIITPEA